MKRSFWKRKPTTPMKRTPMKRGKRLNIVGHSTATQDKNEIQRLLREIVILRDKKCILHGIRCYNTYGDEGIVFQAEHLVERSNGATFADTRLVVLVCKNCHGWKHFKKSNHDQYDTWVKSKLSPERVALWERCESDFHAYKTTKMDWKLELVNLRSELHDLQRIKNKV